MNLQDYKKEVREEYEERFLRVDVATNSMAQPFGNLQISEDILDFILSIRKADLEAVRDLIEGMKTKCTYHMEDWRQNCNQCVACRSYNQAIDDLLTRLFPLKDQP